MKKLLPLILLLVGLGAGVTAGIYLRPDPDPADTKLGSEEADQKDAKMPSEAEKGEESADMEYVKLTNQFVVPVIDDNAVSALVVMSLSIEVPMGKKDVVFQKEPKLRDSFLQVMFDHANVGGFDGAFTDVGTLKTLRRSLREVGQRDLGANVVKDVLILEIARQDY